MEMMKTGKKLDKKEIENVKLERDMAYQTGDRKLIDNFIKNVNKLCISKGLPELEGYYYGIDKEGNIEHPIQACPKVNRPLPPKNFDDVLSGMFGD